MPLKKLQGARWSFPVAAAWKPIRSAAVRLKIAKGRISDNSHIEDNLTTAEDGHPQGRVVTER